VQTGSHPFSIACAIEPMLHRTHASSNTCAIESCTTSGGWFLQAPPSVRSLNPRCLWTQPTVGGDCRYRCAEHACEKKGHGQGTVVVAIRASRDDFLLDDVFYQCLSLPVVLPVVSTMSGKRHAGSVRFSGLPADIQYGYTMLPRGTRRSAGRPDEAVSCEDVSGGGSNHQAVSTRVTCPRI